MLQIFSYLKYFKKQIIISIVLIFMIVLISSFIPFFEGRFVMQEIRDKISGSSSRGSDEYKKYIVMILLFNFALYILCTIVKFIYNKLLVVAIHKSVRILHLDVYKKINKLPISYFDTHTVGNIMTVLNNDIDVISSGLQYTCVSLISSLFSIVVVSALMLVLNWRLGIIVFLMVPLSLFTIWFINKKARNIFIQRFDTTAEYNSFLQEKFTGYKELILYNQQANVCQDFRYVNQKLSKMIFKSHFISGLVMPIVNSFTYVILIVMIILGYCLLQSDPQDTCSFLFYLGFGSIQLGLFQAFIQYIWRLSNPLNDLSNAFVILQSMKAAIQRITVFLNESEEINNPCLLPLETDTFSINFENVCFGYNNKYSIIKNINLFVEDKQMVAIVGPTGSGKTTLMNLLTRFYDVNQGSIAIDGVDIRQLQRSQLRKIVGIVSQDTWLFRGTILENIKYGDLEATDEQVIQIAKQINIHEMIMAKPEGYQTLLNDDSDNLSQGEKQLITIARTLLRDPRILILDEATSTIDTQMEMLLQQAMHKLMQQRTSFVIAHRLSTIVNADIIIVLANGSIIEKGKHTELLDKKGFYYELYHSQFQN